MSTTNRHAMAGRIGAHTRWGNCTDRTTATEAARRSFEDRFLRQVREEHPNLDHQSAVRMAESRRKAYFAQLAQRSVAARRAKQAGGAA